MRFKGDFFPCAREKSPVFPDIYGKFDIESVKISSFGDGGLAFRKIYKNTTELNCNEYSRVTDTFISL